MVKIIAAKNPNELETIAKLAKEIWFEHYVPIIGAQQVEYMLAKYQSYDALSKALADGAKYYILEQDGLPVGYCGILERKNRIYLDKFYVLKIRRGKGVGKETISYLVNYAKEKNKNCIYLTVNKNNSDSILAYKRLGFVVENAVKTDIGNGFFMDDFQMYKYI